MGRGSRHSKSNQSKQYFTYDERNSRTNEYRGMGTNRIATDEASGTIRVRVGSDSQKPFDACWLCNHTATSAIVTNRGLIYCKECIVQNMCHQKNEYKRKLREYEEQQAKKLETDAVTQLVKGELREAAARGAEDSILPTTGSALAKELSDRENKVAEEAASAGKKTQTMNSFWVPQNAPAWTPADVDKPDSTIVCPFTKKPLKIKHLRDVFWTPVPATDKEKQGPNSQFMCPISKVTFKNGTEITVLPSGHAVSKKALQKVIGSAKEQFVCPVTGDTVLRKDVLDIAKSGTGFAASTEGSEVSSVQAEQYRHSLTMAIS
ncbi:Nitric oxide synthase-interacting protein-like protein [Diplonema papillatum]|nr:Nitric oxide synthase-interacting protein-like protein [Diplonema papillatum]